jgi:HSP90 family molecular chaperone
VSWSRTRRAEGRHEYTVLAFVPGSKPFDLFDPGRAGRMKLYVKRVFITDGADILPRYLRFVRGLVDSADLPLNVSREMIQESPILAAIKKGVTSRVLSELEKLARDNAEAYDKVWESFGAVLKEGLYEAAGLRVRLSSRASARAGSRCCSCLTPSTAFGSQPALTTKASRSSRSRKGRRI